ncbi:hypothetical protein DPMN_121750, partial [Dreissena polymorpha]
GVSIVVCQLSNFACPADWRKVQDLGLALYNYMRQLVALPFLPAAHIRETFAALRDRANTPQLDALVTYMDLAADDLDRDVATKYTKLEEKIQSLWDKYMGNEVSTTHFLKSVSRLYGPSDDMTADSVVGLSGE